MPTDTTPCPFCEAEIGVKAKKCRYCGEWVARRCLSCNTPIKGEWAARGYCHECQVRRSSMPVPDPASKALRRGDKSKAIGVILALVLGGIGAHKFYTGRTGKGILYLLFWWTGIPSLLGIVEGVYWATLSDEDFDRRVLT
ncbi:MAG: NINE protein [Longimicrobiales bacterium]|nr:NINE protein [Longimicrobiales bacterium]